MSSRSVTSKMNPSEENTGLEPKKLQKRDDRHPLSPPGRDGEDGWAPTVGWMVFSLTSSSANTTGPHSLSHRRSLGQSKTSEQDLQDEKGIN